jgi:hypothetical protein
MNRSFTHKDVEKIFKSVIGSRHRSAQAAEQALNAAVGLPPPMRSVVSLE